MSSSSEKDFIQRVKQAELDAAANPKAYAIKLGLFALLGYVVILAALFALLGLAGGLAASAFLSTGLFILLLKKKLIIGVLIGIWVLLRALWVKFAPPEGYPLKRKAYPQLFAELDALSKRLKSLKIHQVILDRSLNAAVVQHPRLGVLGWHKNYLILGYQLMLTLSPDEMRSVLAHEFGHLSGNHSRFNGWIYRVRLTWLRVMEAFDQVDSWGTKLMRRFFDWYSPRFEAYSFALARSNEYEADAISAELTSPEVATRALVNVHVTAPYVDDHYWQNYFQQADTSPEPQHAPFKGLSDFLGNNQLEKKELIERIQSAMGIETHYADTHPSLKDRVDALGAEPQLPGYSSENAANAWLGERNREIMAEFDLQWLHENGESWNQRYAYVQTSSSKLEAYATQEINALSDQELWDFAYLSNEFRTADVALPIFRAFQDRYPEDSDAAYFIGHILLAQGDESGLEQLRLACNSAALIEQATYTGFNYLKEKGDDEAAQTWWQASEAQNAVYIAARQERESFDVKDPLISPRIEEEKRQELVAQLQGMKKVGKTWLAQKQVRYFPESPVYVIAFKPKGINFSTDNLPQKIAHELDLDGDFFVVCTKGNTSKLAKKVRKMGQQII
jgi:Zn-dependent protease with chaperone function/rhodanese-related sulfurtransferase